MFRKILLSAICLLPFQGFAISPSELQQLLISSPFSYPMEVQVVPGKKSEIMLCFHGMGESGPWLANRLKMVPELEDTLVTFNFPDHAFFRNPVDFEKTSFGSIQELLPPLYLMKKIVVDGKVSSLSLYGFSAGGGAIVNALGVLNSHSYDTELKNIGITEEHKKTILKAVENGIVILDAPLKSLREIMAARSDFPQLSVVEKRYRENGLEPIDSLPRLKGLDLKILLFFQNPDTILSNRDDQLYINILKSVNNGPVCVVIADDGGHNTLHSSLWQAYAEFLQGTCP